MSEQPQPELPNQSFLFRSGDPNFMTSIARGIEVIRAFSDTHTGMTSAAVSKRTGLSRAVARRCLYTLSEMGYVRQSEDGYYLEPKVLSLSQIYFTSSPLPTLAQDYLDRIKNEIDETCSLAILDGEDIVYIARAVARRLLSVSLSIGSRLPAYCTSLGRILLAFLPPENLDTYLNSVKIEPLTQRTLNTAEALRAELESVRLNQYALVDQELEIGLTTLAVPVQNHRGKVVAAMNVGVQSNRVSVSDLKSRILPVLRKASKELSSQLIF